MRKIIKQDMLNMNVFSDKYIELTCDPIICAISLIIAVVLVTFLRLDTAAYVATVAAGILGILGELMEGDK